MTPAPLLHCVREIPQVFKWKKKKKKRNYESVSVFTSVQVWLQFNWSIFRFYAYILTQMQSNFHKWLHLPCVLYCWWQCRSGRRRRSELKGLASEWVHLIIIPTRGCPSVALRSSIHPISDARGRRRGSDGTWQGAPRSAEPDIF